MIPFIDLTRQHAALRGELGRRPPARPRLEPLRPRRRGPGARARAGDAVRGALGARCRVGHRRASPGAHGRRRGPGRRGHHAGVLVRRVGDHHHHGGRDAGLRRHRPGDLRARRARPPPARSRRARARSCPFISTATRRRWTVSSSWRAPTGSPSSRTRRRRSAAPGPSARSAPGVTPRACRSIRPRISARAATAAWS